MYYRLLAPLITIIFNAAPCYADQPIAGSVRGVTGLPDSLKIDLAKSAEPFWYIPKNGMSLGKAVKTACGNQGAKTDAFLASRVRELNHAQQ